MNTKHIDQLTESKDALTNATIGSLEWQINAVIALLAASLPVEHASSQGAEKDDHDASKRRVR